MPYIRVILFILGLHSISYSQNTADNNSNYEIDEINIKFVGNKTFEESELKNIIESKEGNIFDMEVYLQDVRRIEKFYFDNGFFDCKVDTNLIFHSADREIIENFKVRENKRYRYYEIEYTGLDSIDASAKSKIFNPIDKLLRQGGFYSKDTIKLEVNRVINILNNTGYATALFDSPEIFKYETNDKSLKGKVNIKLPFKPKLRYLFGTTTITFKIKNYNLTTEDIARELTYSAGQLYKKEEVVNSELNLAKISILENPRIIIDKIDSINQRIDLAINVIVGNKYDLTPELGGYYFQNVFYVGTGLSFTDKYFFGGGRNFSMRGRFYFHSIYDNRFEFVNTLTQPFLFNNRNITGNWNLGIEYRLNPDINVTEVKNSFLVTYDLPTYTYVNRLNTKWDMENQNFTLKNYVLEQDTGDFSLNVFSSTLGVEVIHNTVNNIQFPWKGFYQSYSAEESGLTGNLVKVFFNTSTNSFFKFTNFNSGYINLSNREVNVASVIAGKVLGGIIVEYGTNVYQVQNIVLARDQVPTDEKYVCGGSSSIRGWPAQQLGIVSDKSIGGNFLIENSVEHRIRPFLTNENTYIRDLGFATFLDVGNVWSDIGKFKLNEIAIAAGGGIRYYTIIGAIRLDLGFKIYDPQPGPVGGSNWLFGTGCNFNDKYTFQFGIGNTF